MRVEIRNFMNEMDAGLAGAASSLPMIPTYLGAGNAEPYAKPILVIDAGGTNLRAASVRFTEAGLEVLDIVKRKMPGREGAITAAQLFSELVDTVEKVLSDETELCGFCFSYPAEIQENHDGKIIAFSKDVEIEGAEGALIGASMNEELIRRGRKPLQFCVLNDTVATFFGGCSSLPEEAHDSVIGLILGTGINSCYMEQAEKIRKASSASYDMLINIESAKFKKLEMKSFDLRLDENSALPGDAWLEKKISGAYFGDNVYYALLEACEMDAGTGNAEKSSENAFDSAFCARLREAGGIRTSEISLLTEDPYRNDLNGLCVTAEQKEAVMAVADQLIDRAAYLVVCHLAAVMEHCDSGKKRREPATIVVEGSTWQKFHALRERIIYYAHQIIGLEQGRYYRFCEVENSNLIGSAQAALACR
ncbi:MAG: hypothetical protein IJ121_03195 [Eubacterium sp.]|nr:hypothetical protein [Eubacterium sp.]